MPTESEVLDDLEPLIVYLAARYRGRAGELDDLKQEGRIAALIAHRTFDPVKHGTRFSTYAAHLIRNRLIDWIRRRKGAPVPIDPDDLACIPIAEPADRSDFWAAFESARRQLPRLEAAVFSGWVSGLSLEDLALLHVVSIRDARRAVSRGLDLMRSEIRPGDLSRGPLPRRPHIAIRA